MCYGSLGGPEFGSLIHYFISVGEALKIIRHATLTSAKQLKVKEHDTQSIAQVDLATVGKLFSIKHCGRDHCRVEN